MAPVRRAIALLVLVVGLLPLTWLQTPPSKREFQLGMVEFRRIPLPDPGHLTSLGPFTLERAWQMSSTWTRFGSYSGLIAYSDQRLLAVSDFGNYLEFSPPDTRGPAPKGGGAFAHPLAFKELRDYEAATMDPATGTIWIATEYANAIQRFAPEWQLNGTFKPHAMRDWPSNTGPEALTRLHDGRFIVVREGTGGDQAPGAMPDGGHQAILFARDPIEGMRGALLFTLEGPRHFSAVDMATMPDGRVLVLFRKLIWPMPQRFAARIAIGDPGEIRQGQPWKLRTLARINSTLPVDNFEGLAIAPRKDGTLTIWLISDDNRSNFQKTLLWKLRLDPASV